MAQLAVLSRPLRYFMEVAQCGSVNQAAGRLFVAPSAVSRQIAQLEDALGTALFERHTRGMDLTAAGHRLVGHLRHATLDAEQVLEQVRQLGGVAAQRVRLACTEGFAAGFMAAFVQALQQAQPHSAVELLVGSPDEVSQWLRRGETDVGLKYAVAPEAGLRVEHAAQAPVLAVMTPDHPLARQPAAALADVVRYPLLVGHPGVTARQLFDLACSAQGLQYQPVFVSNFSSVMLPLLRSPQVLLSGLLTVSHRVARRELVAVPIEEPLLTQRRMQVLSLEGRTLPEPVRACIVQLVAAIDEAGRAPKAATPRRRASAA